MVSSIIVHHCLWTLWSIYSVPSVCGASWQGSYLHQGWTRNCTRALNGGTEFGSFQSLWRCRRRYLRRTHITKSIHPVVFIDEAVEDQNWLFKPSVTRLVCSSLFVRMYIVNFFVLCLCRFKVWSRLSPWHRFEICERFKQCEGWQTPWQWTLSWCC